ncbi:peptidase inhibitor family I36 protein [Streptomyces sp. NPDC005955]|uniref:peptidase inhibitor family I36 protein n=1 Tax=Streptomyces sp. NPDC005955 TaxID=3364738 RepID=UPI003680E565
MRRIARLAAAAALTSGLAAVPAPASAAPTALSHFTGSHCPSKSLCLYRDRDFSGGGIAIRAGDHIGFLGEHGVNDRMSSWSNDSGATCTWWSDAHERGTPHLMYHGYRVNVRAAENDTASSVHC